MEVTKGLYNFHVELMVLYRLHRHLFFNHRGRRGTVDDFTANFLDFSLFFTALWDLANSRPVHSPMLSSHLFESGHCCHYLGNPDARCYLCTGWLPGT